MGRRKSCVGRKTSCVGRRKAYTRIPHPDIPKRPTPSQPSTPQSELPHFAPSQEATQQTHSHKNEKLKIAIYTQQKRNIKGRNARSLVFPPKKFGEIKSFFYFCTRKQHKALKTATLPNFVLVCFDPLAQLVEQYTFNVWVLGSSPKRITEVKSARVFDKDFADFPAEIEWAT